MSVSQWLKREQQDNDIWKTIYQHSPQPTLVGSLDDVILEVNAAARDLLKLSEENIKGQRLSNIIARLSTPQQSMIRFNSSIINSYNEPFKVIYLQNIYEQKFSERLLLFFATTLKSLDFPSNISLNLHSMMSETANLSVKSFADWCRIDILEQNGLKLKAIGHSSPEQKLTLEELDLNEYDNVDDLFSPLKVIRSGNNVFESIITRNSLQHLRLTSKNLQILLEMGINSYICVPIKTSDNILGCISLGRSYDKPKFDSIDLIMAEEFASKVGINIERTQLYKNLEEMKTKADVANQTKTNFLANVSHEIRTPLGAILGFSELLTAGDQSSQDYLNWKAKIRSNSRYLLKIIDDILDLSKIEAGKLNIEIASLNLKQLLRNVYEDAKSRACDKPVQIEFSLEEAIPRYIFSDETRLSQILSNIVGNSIKFTNEGYVHLKVRWLKNTRELLLFEISDSGIGIADDQSSSLFMPFSQADASYTRKYGGTGLGLALSRNLARELGGDLTLEQSVPGKGTTFWITIDPGKVNKKEVFTELTFDDPPQIAEEEPTNSNQPLKDKQILLVEDSSDIRILIKRFLEGAGARVVLATNGEEGLQAAREKSFDIILMDIQMPVKDGCTATCELRSLGYNGLIIALTAHAMKEEYECCIKAGYDGHLSKPIRRQDLITSILKLEQSHKETKFKAIRI